jgi:hypothetical protein
MGSSRYSTGVRGIRSGHWSGSKFTNLTEFDPSGSELDSAWEKYFDRIHNSPDLTIIVQPVHSDFVLPIDKASIREALSAVPKKFLQGLKGVVTLSGSKKQEKASNSLFAYGVYTSNVIFLHPFPKKFLDRIRRGLPKPSALQEFERAGAKITRDGKYWRMQFDEIALKQFYLKEVLLHELGHHVDSKNSRFKTDKKAEGFADWFASEYGYKLRIRERRLE